MGALAFLAKHGPQEMGLDCDEFGDAYALGSDAGSSAHLRSMLDVPPSMERLLVPTKCWAQRIGITTGSDVREQRRPVSSGPALRRAGSTGAVRGRM